VELSETLALVRAKAFQLLGESRNDTSPGDGRQVEARAAGRCEYCRMHSRCKEPPSMSSISCHSLAVDERSSTISRGRVRAAIYTNPTVLQASILRLATRSAI